MCKSTSTVSRPSLIRDLSHTFALLRVEKQSWGDKFVIWEEFMRPWNRKIGKTGYQKKLFRDHSMGGDHPHRPTMNPTLSGGALWAPPVGSGAKPQPPTVLVHFQDLGTLLIAPKMCFCNCTTIETTGQSNLTKSASREPIPRLGVTPGGRKLYRWIPGVGFPISVP